MARINRAERSRPLGSLDRNGAWWVGYGKGPEREQSLIYKWLERKNLSAR